MNRGTVQLDVVAKGQDEVSAMLRKVGDQAKATEKQLDGMADSTAKIGNQTGANKLVAGIEKVDNAVEGAAQGIEKFNKVIGIAGFIGVAIAAVPAVVAFVKELFNVQDASDRAKEAIGTINKVLIENRDLFREFAIARAQTQAEAESLKILTEIEKVQEKGAEIVRARIDAESALALLKEEQLRLENAVLYANQEWGKGMGPANAAQANLNRSISEQQALAEEINKARAAEAEFVTQLNFLEGKRAELIKESFAAMFQGLSLERQMRQALGLKVEPLAPVKTPKAVIVTKGPSGVAKPKGEEIISELDAEIRIRDAIAEARRDEYKDLVKLGEEKTRQRIEDEQAVAEAMKALDIRLELAAIKPQVDGIMQAADAMQTFAAAIGDAAAAFPDLQSALDATMGTWSKYSETVQALNQRVADGHMKEAEFTIAAEQAKTNAIIAGTTEGLASVAKLIGGLRAEYIVRAAGELAAGFATLANPVESAGHFTAAGLYAIAAGTTLPSGGAGARGGAGTGAANDTGGTMATPTERREPRTIVYNFSTLIADRQQVHRAIRDSELVAERNGYGRRRGV